MKLRWALIATISSVLLATLGARTHSALAPDTSGWLNIVPDESLTGWTRIAIPPGKPRDPVSQWKLDKANHFIVCEGDHGHEWLRYDRVFTNFIFHAEWRFTAREGLKGYNSGVFVRNNADGSVWHQAQVGAGNDGYLFGQTLVNGKISAIMFGPKPKVNRLKPPGEWNVYEVRCEGPKITLWVNGGLSSEFNAPEVPRGYVGLEAEGFRIEFRNLKVKVLP
jgi:hypothetical protein